MTKKIIQYTPRNQWEPTWIQEDYLTHTKKDDEPETTLGTIPMCTECASFFECGIVRDALALERTYNIAIAILECPRFIQSTGRNNI
jgi:hypothetical protein